MFSNYSEAASAWEADRRLHEEKGIHLNGVRAYAFDGVGRDYTLAMDAQPTLVTDPNSAIPAMLTTMIDPTVIRVVQAPVNATKIVGEIKKGTWLDQTAMFPVVEHTGEVSSYGDYATSGMSGMNMDFPQRQAYQFQTLKRYGEMELERAGLARINMVNELDMSAANNIARFFNLSYFYGIQGLQNYGLFNDPNLAASLTPAAKAYGGTAWYSGNVVRATANEIFLDIQTMVASLINQTTGYIDSESKMTIALSPLAEAAFATTNSFKVNVRDLIKDNYPGMKIQTAVQYQAQSSANPQGLPAGNFMQLIANDIDGMQVAFCAFTEKMRAHPIIRLHSSFEQKVSAGTWGFVLRIPIGIASMVGI